MSNNSDVKFRVKAQKIISNAWSVGINFSHWYDETYLFINLFRWTVTIGFLYCDLDD